MPSFQRSIRWYCRNDKIHLKVPFNIAFNQKQKELELGGLWSKEGKVWIFPIENAEKLKNLLYFVYGDDGHQRFNQCNLRVDVVRSNPLIGDATCAAIHFLGYPIARATGNHSEVKLLSGLTVTAGGFTSGGSVKHWQTCVSRNTSFIINAVSYPFWEQERERYRQEIYDGLIDVQVIEHMTDRPGYEIHTFDDTERKLPATTNEDRVVTTSYINDYVDHPLTISESLEELYATRETLFEQLALLTLKIKKLERNSE